MDIEKKNLRWVTGNYSNILKVYCIDNEIQLYLKDNVQIKIYSGTKDTEKIAEYNMRYKHMAEHLVLENIE